MSADRTFDGSCQFVVDVDKQGRWLWRLTGRRLETPDWLDMGTSRSFHAIGSEAHARRKAQAWIARQNGYARNYARNRSTFTVRSALPSTKEGT